MSGRGGQRSCRSGHGNNSGRSGHGRGRGQNYTGASSTLKKGLCSALGTNVFDYGHKAAADQLRTSWEKLVDYVGTNYGQDISNELQNKLTVTLAEPAHDSAVLQRHAVREQMIRNGQANLQQARQAQQTILRKVVKDKTDPKAPMKLAILENKIAQGTFEQQAEVTIEMSDSEKMQYNNEWRTY